ncbi:MAG: AraC family transcriptional regulator, partial [Bacteroidota bacterium]
DVELIKNVCKLIYKESGNITVAEIAERFNLYRQRLSFLFIQEVKYTIKKFINCVRIRACLQYKLEHPEISLTEIGHKFGFYDQAHFIRSFKSACGITPSEYVKTPGYSLTGFKANK